MNADEIARGLGVSANRAGEIADKVRADLVARRKSFVFATVLPLNVLLERLRSERSQECGSPRSATFPLLFSLALFGDFLPVGFGLAHANRVGVLLGIFPCFGFTLLALGLPCGGTAGPFLLLRFAVVLGPAPLLRRRVLARVAFSFPAHHL